MIRETHDYLINETLPRFKAIVLGPELFLSVAVAVLAAVYSESLSLWDIKVSSVSGAVLNYSAIAFGFAVTGMTLAISIPDKKLAVKMAKTKVGKKCAYSSLIFVFSWTALAHLLLIFFCIILLATTGDERFVVNGDQGIPSVCEKRVIGAFTFLTTYGFIQFFMTIVTISQVGHVYTEQLQKEKDE